MLISNPHLRISSIKVPAGASGVTCVNFNYITAGKGRLAKAKSVGYKEKEQPGLDPKPPALGSVHQAMETDGIRRRRFMVSARVEVTDKA